MKPDRAAIGDKVSQWMSYSGEDLRLARVGLALRSSCPFRLVAYHAQQCAEKCLKAYLVYHETDFPYTHSISRLLELCAPVAPWGSSLLEAEELTPFAITARYPGEDEMVTRREARRALEIAMLVRRTVGAALKREGFAGTKQL